MSCYDQPTLTYVLLCGGQYQLFTVGTPCFGQQSYTKQEHLGLCRLTVILGAFWSAVCDSGYRQFDVTLETIHVVSRCFRMIAQSERSEVARIPYVFEVLCQPYGQP